MKVTVLCGLDEKFDFMRTGKGKFMNTETIWMLLATNHCGKKYFILKVVCIDLIFVLFCFILFYRQLFSYSSILDKKSGEEE